MTELPTDYDNLLYYLEQQFPATQGHIPLRTCIMNMKHRVADLEQKLTEARKDTEMLDWLDKTYLHPEFYMKMASESDHRNYITLAMKERTK